jgi:GT2 family glycosyltransferase
MTLPEAPRVSVFIPTYNDAEPLAACLESLGALDYPRGQVEIVVWDNASRDDTGRRVAEAFDRMRGQGWLDLRLLRSPRNEGSYVPYNLAETQLVPGGAYILGLDADVEIAPDALTRLVAVAEAGGVAVVGARSVYFERPDRTAHGAGFVARWSARYGEADPEEPIDCDYVIGCCWLLHRRAFREAGGFDPRFFINHWEVDYCLRLKQRGWRICYEPRAVALHKIAPGGTRSPERLYYLYRNKLLVIRTSGYFRRPILAAVVATAGAAARIVADALATSSIRETVASLRGLWDGLRGRTGALRPARS